MYPEYIEKLKTLPVPPEPKKSPEEKQ